MTSLTNTPIGLPRFTSNQPAPADAWKRRLNSALKEDVLAFNQGQKPDQAVDTLMRLKAPVTPATEQELQQAGLTIHSKTGVIVTGVIMLSKVQALAEKDHLVLRIESSRDLFGE